MSAVPASTSLASLRRATAADIPAVVALQRAAYAQNWIIIGVEPLPLKADYDEIFRDHEVWLAEEGASLIGALIVQARLDDLLIWNVSTALSARGKGIGNRLLAAAEDRARELGLSKLRLYTGEKLVSNVAWYGRHGYVVERVEQLSDRRAVHMMKTLV